MSGQVIDLDTSTRSGAVRKFTPSFVDLGFLRDVGHSLLRGWTTRSELSAGEDLPLSLLCRLRAMVSRHVDAVVSFETEVEGDGWAVIFVTEGPQGESYTYSFAVSLA